MAPAVYKKYKFHLENELKDDLKFTLTVYKGWYESGSKETKKHAIRN